MQSIQCYVRHTHMPWWTALVYHNILKIFVSISFTKWMPSSGDERSTCTQQRSYIIILNYLCMPRYTKVKCRNPCSKPSRFTAAIYEQALRLNFFAFHPTSSSFDYLPRNEGNTVPFYNLQIFILKKKWMFTYKTHAQYLVHTTHTYELCTILIADPQIGLLLSNDVMPSTFSLIIGNAF